MPGHCVGGLHSQHTGAGRPCSGLRWPHWALWCDSDRQPRGQQAQRTPQGRRRPRPRVPAWEVTPSLSPAGRCAHTLGRRSRLLLSLGHVCPAPPPLNEDEGRRTQTKPRAGSQTRWRKDGPARRAANRGVTEPFSRNVSPSRGLQFL